MPSVAGLGLNMVLAANSCWQSLVLGTSSMGQPQQCLQTASHTVSTSWPFIQIPHPSMCKIQHVWLMVGKKQGATRYPTCLVPSKRAREDRDCDRLPKGRTQGAHRWRVLYSKEAVPLHPELPVLPAHLPMQSFQQAQEEGSQLGYSHPSANHLNVHLFW